MVRVPGISGAIRIAVGYGRTCVVLGDRTVRCWGNNDRRELGDGTALDRASPVRVLGLEGVREITLGETHACALREDGTEHCWGSGADRVKIYGVADVQEVHAGSGFTCARMRDRSVKCWGNNHYGLLGDGTTVDTDAPVLVKF